MEPHENAIDPNSTNSLVSPSSPSTSSDSSRNSSARLLSNSSSIPPPPQLQHHGGTSTNSMNNRTCYKQEQCIEAFEASNVDNSNSSIPPSPTNLATSGSKGNAYSGTVPFSAATGDHSSNSAQTAANG